MPDPIKGIRNVSINRANSQGRIAVVGFEGQNGYGMHFGLLLNCLDRNLISWALIYFLSLYVNTIIEITRLKILSKHNLQLQHNSSNVSIYFYMFLKLFRPKVRDNFIKFLILRLYSICLPLKKSQKVCWVQRIQYFECFKHFEDS